MARPATLIRSRAVRTGVASTALAGLALGLAVPAANAEMINLNSPYFYKSTSSSGQEIYNILGGYDAPAGMPSNTGVAFCIEMGVYFPSSTTPVVKQFRTNEYPAIAYVINKWSGDRSPLNQAAIALAVHSHLDVHDADFYSKYGIIGGDTTKTPAEYQAKLQAMIDTAPQDVKNLAAQYWAEAEANASATASYAAVQPNLSVTKVSNDASRKSQVQATGFRVNNGSGNPISGATQIRVNITGGTVNGQSSYTTTIDQANGGTTIDFTPGQTVQVQYDTVDNMPSNELVIAQMGPHDGGEGYDGTGRYPSGHPQFPNQRKSDRRGDPTQTSITAVSGTIDVAEAQAQIDTPNPGIKTTATDKADGDKNVAQRGGTVVDTVEYSGLISGREYSMSGALHVKNADGTDGGVLKDADGKDVTASTKFTADASGAGTVNLEFVLPDNAEGETLVAFETAESPEGDYAVHADINDEAQTVYVSFLRSEIADDADGDRYLAQAGGTVTDTVDYANLKVGTNYRIATELLDRETGESTGIVQEATFTPEAASGEQKIQVQIQVPSGYRGRTLLAVQTIYEGDTVVASDRHIADAPDGDKARELETIYVSDLGTTALDTADGDKNLVQSGASITDTVAYTNLAPGQEYTVSGELMDKATGKTTGVVASAKFTPETANGTVDVVFDNLPASVAGKTLVAFETVTAAPAEEGGEAPVVAEHTDIDDAAQTTYVADIGTTATDKLDGDKSVQQKGGTVVDAVKYTNLVVGQEYKIDGTLMDKGTGKPLTDAEGKEITSSTTFTPEEANGTVNLEFALPDGAAGKTLVAFESVSNEVGIVAVHEDINDNDQTVEVIDIGTKATDASDGDKRVAYDGVIRDEVRYENLVAGKTYVLKGELRDQETGEAVIDQTTGKPVVGETTFTPEQSDGSAAVAFKLGSVPNTTTVAFETLYDTDGNVLAEHKDLDDRGQTVVTEDVPPTPPTPNVPPTPGTPGVPGTDGDNGANAVAADNGAAQADNGAGLARTGVNAAGGLGALLAAGALTLLGSRGRRFLTKG